MDKDTTDHIINALRRSTISWKGRSECLRLARKGVHDGQFYKNGGPIYKLHWQCSICSLWFRNELDMEVDHIEAIGSFTGDWNEYISRMFCGQSNLQALCTLCHLKKTSAGNATTRYKRKEII